MAGNVSEWCWDRKGSYSSSAETDPTGSTGGRYRVYRGGSWVESENSLTSTGRSSQHLPHEAVYNIGFRIAAGF